MNLESTIYIAGHRGLVGSALLRSLQESGYRNLITRTHGELDLESQPAVDRFFADQRPRYVLLAAAKVGGIHANSTYPVDFLLRNLRIQTNVIEASWRYQVAGLLFLGSSCIYPKLAPQPLKEEYVLTGLLEATNEPYAIAKISGIELCEAYNRQYGTRFLSVMPTNLYGLHDNYDLESSHVLPALIRKFHLAKLARQGDWSGIKHDEATRGPIPADFFAALTRSGKPDDLSPPRAAPNASDRKLEPAVRLWGTGSPRREFLFADDLADACAFLMNRLDDLFGGNAPPPGTQLPAFDTRRPAPFADPSSVATDRCSFASHHLINIGRGEDLTIRELASMVAEIVGYDGAVEWDPAKPDGTPRKLLDVSRLTNLGWKPKISLEEGIRSAYRDYLESSG
jgi:GDP-L-fucose synthase